MDNLFDTYKQIIDRAVELGLLPEENRTYYLSSVDEERLAIDDEKETDSLLEEMQSALKSMEDKRQRNRTFEAHANFKRQVENSKESPFNKTNLSGDSSVNYNILEVENLRKIEQESGDCVSELSYLLDELCRVTSRTDNMASKPSKVRNRPKKGEVVDFHIPIYYDIKKNKIAMKPSGKKKTRASNKANKMYYDLHVTEDEISKMSPCKHSRYDASKHYEEDSETKQLSKSTHISSKVDYDTKDLTHIKETERNTICLVDNPNSKYLIPKDSVQRNPFNREPIKSHCNGGMGDPHKMQKQMLTAGRCKWVPNILSCRDGLCNRCYQEMNHGSFDPANEMSTSFDIVSGDATTNVPREVSAENNGKSIRLKMTKDWQIRNQEPKENFFDDQSMNESIDHNTVRLPGKDNRLNVNIYCQFFPSEKTTDNQDLSKSDGSLTQEVETKQDENNHKESKPLKKGILKKTAAHYFSKIFPKNKFH